MITIVGFLTFISRINTTSDSSKARKIIIFQHFSFFLRVENSCSVEMSMKNFHDLGPGGQMGLFEFYNIVEKFSVQIFSVNMVLLSLYECNEICK